jgi:glycosyltransferase involved in cell wall biosynthesis
MSGRKTNPDIALYISNMEAGGAEVMMLHLAQGFAAKGLTVDIVLVKATGPLLKRVPENVRVVDLNCAHTYSSLGQLIRYLRREKPRAVISGLDAPNLISIVARWFAGYHFRHCITVHSVTSLVFKPENADVNTRTLRARLSFLAVQFFYRFADHIVAVSSGAGDDIAKLAHVPREKVQIFYLPVLTPAFEKKLQAPIPHEWLQPGQPPVIMGVGRLAAAKDFPTLIKAFAILRKKQSVRLMIIGEGELRPELENLIRSLGLEDSVALPGFAENQFAYLKHASVFALSSAWEGLAMVIVEALACGTKVVSTDCQSGPSEILEGGKWGRLVPVGDSEAMAAAMEKALNEPPIDPPQAVMNRFSLDTVVRRYEQLLLENNPSLKN